MVRVRINKSDGSLYAEYEHLADTTTLEDVIGIFAAENELEPEVITLLHNTQRYDPLHNAQDGKVTLNELCINVTTSSATEQLITLQAVFANTNLTSRIDHKHDVNNKINGGAASSSHTTTTSSTPHSTQTAKVQEVKQLTSNLRQLMEKRGRPIPSATTASGTTTTATNNNRHNLFAPHNNALHMNEPMLDETSVEVQEKLLKAIQQHNIDQNFMEAMEEIPEAYVRVPMLYIKCTINHVPLKAFIDTGAQNSIMTSEIAEKCNLSRLIDTRMSGIAVGVGQAKIIGRIHMALVEIDRLQVPCTFMVLEGKQNSIELIIGLDQMRRHCMILDLKENALRIGPANVYFLPESELPPALKYEELIEGKENNNNTESIADRGESKTIDKDNDNTHEQNSVTNKNSATNTNINTEQQKQQEQKPLSESNAGKVQTKSEANNNNEHIFTTYTNALSESNRTKLHSFMAFTGITDVKLAQELLEASAWDVDHAAALFYNDDE